MKKVIYSLLIMLILGVFTQIRAQAPPPPNNGNSAGPGNTPVGANGAPIGGGMGILLAYFAFYGIKKYRASQKEGTTQTGINH